METVEQIKSWFNSGSIDEEDYYAIIGYLNAKGLDKEEYTHKYPEQELSFEDFLKWFESEDKIKWVSNNEIYDISSIFFGFPLYEMLRGNDFPCDKCECNKNKFKYKGEEREILNKEFINKKKILFNLENMATYYSDKNILVAIDNIRKEIDEIDSKLQEQSNEK